METKKVKIIKADKGSWCYGMIGRIIDVQVGRVPDPDWIEWYRIPINGFCELGSLIPCAYVEDVK